MRYLIEYFMRWRGFIGRRIYYLLALMMAAGFIEAASITLFLPVLQTGFGDDKLSRILKAVFGFFGLDFSFRLFLILITVFFVFRVIFLVSYARYAGKLMSDILVKLRRNVLESAFSADYTYILKKEIGYMNNAIVREIAGVIDAFRTFSQVLKYTILALVYIALSFMLNPKISVVVMVLCPAIIFLTLRLNRLVSQASLDYSFLHGSFHSILFQALGKFKYFKATLSNDKVSKIINRLNEKLGLIRFRIFFLQSFSKDAFESVVVISVVGLLFYYVVALQRSVNEIIFLIFLFLQAARQFLTLQSSYRKFLAAKGSIETFNKFEKELKENKEVLNLKGPAPDFDKSIILKNVTVIFPNGKKALDNVNIDIKPRSTVAFVGHSGSGKSTIANVIAGILKPASGIISFGDIGYDRLNLKTLRKNIGYITQEDVIFNASVKDNITLWSEDVGKDKLTGAIKMAHITGFIQDLPEKENSMLGDNGLDISGGQRQRITIARELYKDTKLLILDEATSSLDSKSENQIYENLKEFKGRKTMIVIAHRLSTIKNADYIYVMDEGKVAEEGAYGGLYQKSGEFKKMIDDQKLI